MATLRLEIVTPEAVVFSDDVEMVTLPGSEGEMGVYPLHVPLMTRIVPGELIVNKGGKTLFLAVGEGFAEVTEERVSILADMAIRAENIDEAQAEEARRRAESRLSEQLTEEESAKLQAALTHSLTQLKVKRQRKPRS